MDFDEIINIIGELPDESAAIFVELISVVEPDTFPQIRQRSLPDHSITSIDHFFAIERFENS